MNQLLVISIIISFGFMQIGCQPALTQNSSNSFNSLCGNGNPLRPIPGVPDFDTLAQTYNLTIEDFNEFQCFMAYQKFINLAPATEINEQAVPITFTASDIDYSHIQSTGSDILFYDLEDNELSHWVQKWVPNGESIIWVKIPQASTSRIKMIYGNPQATENFSNNNAVFNYSTPYPFYTQLRDGPNNLDIHIASYVDNNSFTLETLTGPTSQSLNFQQTSAIGQNIQGLISSTGPLSGQVNSVSDGYDSIVALSLAFTLSGYPDSRSTEVWEFYNPNNQIANITIENYNNSGTLGGQHVDTINPLSFKKINFSVQQFGVVSSDIPIIGMVSGVESTDSYILVPGDTNILGVNSRTSAIGILEDSTDLTIYRSGSSAINFSGDKGDTYVFTGGSAGEGSALRVVSNRPVVGSSQGDGDGTDASSFFPESQLSSEYILPFDSQYLALSIPHANTNISIFAPDGSLITVESASGSEQIPAKLRFGATTGINYSAGTRISGNQAFFMYYEFSNQDESNLMGPLQARPYGLNEITVTFEEEESLY